MRDGTQIAILSDIHGNVSALNRVLEDIKKNFHPDYYALLGDNIDYGMRSNEVIEILRGLDCPLICDLWGNHEKAIMTEDYSRFSSQRGVVSAAHTRKNLTKESLAYIDRMKDKGGISEFVIEDTRFLAVHGSLADIFWGKTDPFSDLGGYEKYDIVLSGHTHLSHCFPVFYASDHAEYRGKKKTVFINPGSIGQPRNHNPKAQYAVWDKEAGVVLRQVDYDIAYEQSLYTDDVDIFYRERLSRGI